MSTAYCFWICLEGVTITSSSNAPCKILEFFQCYQVSDHEPRICCQNAVSSASGKAARSCRETLSYPNSTRTELSRNFILSKLYSDAVTSFGHICGASNPSQSATLLVNSGAVPSPPISCRNLICAWKYEFNAFLSQALPSSPSTNNARMQPSHPELSKALERTDTPAKACRRRAASHIQNSRFLGEHSTAQNPTYSGPRHMPKGSAKLPQSFGEI